MRRKIEMVMDVEPCIGSNDTVIECADDILDYVGFTLQSNAQFDGLSMKVLSIKMIYDEDDGK